MGLIKSHLDKMFTSSFDLPYTLKLTERREKTDSFNSY